MRGIFKRKKRGTLANVLLKNYILSYFIITLILIIGITITIILSIVLYFNIEMASLENAYNIMKDDYTAIDTSEIEKLNGYIEVIDKNHNVIYQKGGIPNKKEKYLIEDYNKIFESNSMMSKKDEGPSINFDLNPETYTKNDNAAKDASFIYRLAYNKNKDFLLVVAIPKAAYENSNIKLHSLKPKHFFLVALFTGIFILVLVFIIFSRVSSKNFIVPLKILTQGAKKLSEGDFSTRIMLKSENEFGELRDAFNTMAEKIELERNLKEKSEENRRRLILDISHDLKNPLSSIMGYSDLLTKNPDIEIEERLKYLNVIHSNSVRANNLITDLFEFSKLQSNDFQLKLKSSDICEFIRELIASYIPLIEEKNFIYDFNIPEESFYIAFDEKHLDRALSNIILNSIKYNPQGTKLLIRAIIKEPYFELIIEDDGIGIPEELKEEIFSPFVRVDSARNSKSGGTGLGLAISKSIINKHGGELCLESSSNLGSKFTIILKS
ncbi:sensor histidine kinase [Desnuesiella massiliensis]|uniref:sensor histidine kinase n=1 Tax=Desnuesiella massiliensis TaxID=1650662 RepID=UPI0006E35A6A|nr:HAMP domain-containing sensor histidine kinase [Desnuesiella massiliensis]